jgi:hypothetical protein
LVRPIRFAGFCAFVVVQRTKKKENNTVAFYRIRFQRGNAYNLAQHQTQPSIKPESEKNKNIKERRPNTILGGGYRLSACSPRVRVRNQLETFVFQTNSVSLLTPHHTAVGYRYYPG